MKTLEFKKLNVEARIPTRNHPEDAGLDLYALEDIFLPLNSTVKVSTGIATNIPSGYYGKIEDRSGTAAKGLRTGGGILDVGYQGELTVVMHNLTNSTDTYIGKQGYLIKKHDRIAQIVIIKCEFPEPVEVQSFEETVRGTKGFGSSGN